MQAINEKNGKKCQTIDSILQPLKRKEEKLKIYENMKENEKKSDLKC